MADQKQTAFNTSEMIESMHKLSSDIGNRLHKLQNQRYVWGDDRIDQTTLSMVAKLDSMLSQMPTDHDHSIDKDAKIRQLQTDLTLRKDQCVGLRESLQLANYRELRLIRTIDDQRNAIRKSEQEKAELRNRIAELEKNMVAEPMDDKKSDSTGMDSDNFDLEFNVDIGISYDQSD